MAEKFGRSHFGSLRSAVVFTGGTNLEQSGIFSGVESGGVYEHLLTYLIFGVEVLQPVVGGCEHGYGHGAGLVLQHHVLVYIAAFVGSNNATGENHVLIFVGLPHLSAIVII